MKLWRGQPDNWTFKPTPREVARVEIGLAVVSYAVAGMEFLSPSPSSGGLLRTVAKAFGPNGEVYLFAGLGTVLLIAGVLKYRR